MVNFTKILSFVNKFDIKFIIDFVEIGSSGFKRFWVFNFSKLLLTKYVLVDI